MITPIIYNDNKIEFVSITKRNYLRLNEIKFDEFQYEFLKIKPEKILNQKKRGYNCYLIMINNIVIGYRTFSYLKNKKTLIFCEMGLDVKYQRKGIWKLVNKHIIDIFDVNKFIFHASIKNKNVLKPLLNLGFERISGMIYIKYKK